MNKYNFFIVMVLAFCIQNIFARKGLSEACDPTEDHRFPKIFRTSNGEEFHNVVDQIGADNLDWEKLNKKFEANKPFFYNPKRVPRKDTSLVATDIFRGITGCLFIGALCFSGDTIFNKPLSKIIQDPVVISTVLPTALAFFGAIGFGQYINWANDIQAKRKPILEFIQSKNKKS